MMCVFADAMDDLLARIMAVFPQCDDTVKRGQGKFVAHVSVAKCKNEQQLRSVQAKLEASFRPISFTLKEIYLLHRCVSPPTTRAFRSVCAVCRVPCRACVLTRRNGSSGKGRTHLR
jgi:hypothetical protein